MQKTKLLIVYSANSPAAEFILHGADKDKVTIQKLELKDDYCSKVLFLLFYILRLYKLSSYFRFKSHVRTEIARQRNQILFWDCCDLYLYKLLDKACYSNTKKSIFFWNPLDLHKHERVPINDMIRWLKENKYHLSTFDPSDAQCYKLPLYLNVNRMVDVPASENESDFYFVGLPKGRDNLIYDIKKALSSKGYKVKFIIPQNKSEYISLMQNIVNSSKTRCIVDIVSSKYGQKGLTLRPFDALFLKKKLLSNCESLVDCDFYHKNNIYIFSNIVELEDIDRFMQLPYYDIDESIVMKYEINNWLTKYYIL